MEGKKKFEKPELKVVEMELRPLAAGSCNTQSHCDFECCGCQCDE